MTWRKSSSMLITSSIQQNRDANNGMQGVATAAQYYQQISVQQHHTDDHCALADQSPTGTCLLRAVLSVSALLGLWGQCPSSYPGYEVWWPCADSRAGTRKGIVSLFGIRRAMSVVVAPPFFNAPILPSQP